MITLWNAGSAENIVNSLKNALEIKSAKVRKRKMSNFPPYFLFLTQCFRQGDPGADVFEEHCCMLCLASSCFFIAILYRAADISFKIWVIILEKSLLTYSKLNLSAARNFTDK